MKKILKPYFTAASNKMKGKIEKLGLDSNEVIKAKSNFKLKIK
jgi:hypothetical protein